MTLRAILLTSAAIVAICGLLFAVFLPPRVAEHGDDHSGELPTERRYVSLAAYFVTAHPTGSSFGENRIGSTPYSLYYVRTYAGELFLVSVVLLFITGVIWMRHRE